MAGLLAELPDWDQLDPERRGSSMLQADHILVELRRIGCEAPGVLERLSAIGDAEGEQVSAGRYPVVNVPEAWELGSALGVTVPGVQHHYEQSGDGAAHGRGCCILTLAGGARFGRR